MSLEKETEIFERKFYVYGGWVKSDQEKIMERKEEYKLASSFVLTGTKVVRPEIDTDAVREIFGDCETLVTFGAFDHFACPQPGYMLYIRKSGLQIIPDEVVFRDWDRLVDRPYSGNKEFIMAYSALQQQMVDIQHRKKSVFEFYGQPQKDIKKIELMV